LPLYPPRISITINITCAVGLFGHFPEHTFLNSKFSLAIFQISPKNQMKIRRLSSNPCIYTETFMHQFGVRVGFALHNSGIIKCEKKMQYRMLQEPMTYFQASDYA